jgi:hypothetical protein
VGSPSSCKGEMLLFGILGSSEACEAIVQGGAELAETVGVYRRRGFASGRSALGLFASRCETTKLEMGLKGATSSAKRRLCCLLAISIHMVKHTTSRFVHPPAPSTSPSQPAPLHSHFLHRSSGPEGYLHGRGDGSGLGGGGGLHSLLGSGLDHDSDAELGLVELVVCTSGRNVSSKRTERRRRD